MMDDRLVRRAERPEWWTSIIDRACIRLARIAILLLALILAAQAALADDGLRYHLSATERLEGAPYGGR